MRFSSGDLLADRRFDYAQAAADEGDHATAADVLAQTMPRVPNWAPGWLALGQSRERAGLAGALDAYRHAAALDAAGTLGAGLHVSRFDGRAPDQFDAAYVRALFDDYAPRFEAHLTLSLGYDGPARLLAVLERVGPLRFESALDVGCGTGLMARALAGYCATIEGVDLSPAMIARAAATRLYARLAVADALAYLAWADAATFDLVVAADVLAYVGALDALMRAVAGALRPGGLFAFTVQIGPAQGFALGADMRFAHAPAYVRACVEAAGLVMMMEEPASIRRDAGLPVPGLAVVVRAA